LKLPRVPEAFEVILLAARGRFAAGGRPRFTQFYDKLKNDPVWTVHTLSCSHFIQLEMPDELTAILLKAIP